MKILTPRCTIPPRCVACQAVWKPSCELYWHMGLTMMRFCISTPRILSGVNSFGTGLPSGCGVTAVPDGGFCAGV